MQYLPGIVSGELRETSGGITQHVGVLRNDVLVQERGARVDHEGLQAHDASLGHGILGGLGAGGPSLCGRVQIEKKRNRE